MFQKTKYNKTILQLCFLWSCFQLNVPWEDFLLYGHPKQNLEERIVVFEKRAKTDPKFFLDVFRIMSLSIRIHNSIIYTKTRSLIPWAGKTFIISSLMRQMSWLIHRFKDFQYCSRSQDHVFVQAQFQKKIFRLTLILSGGGRGGMTWSGWSILYKNNRRKIYQKPY